MGKGQETLGNRCPPHRLGQCEAGPFDGARQRDIGYELRAGRDPYSGLAAAKPKSG